MMTKIIVYTRQKSEHLEFASRTLALKGNPPRVRIPLGNKRPFPMISGKASQHADALQSHSLLSRRSTAAAATHHNANRNFHANNLGNFGVLYQA